MTCIFWSTILGVVYAYLGYPFLLWVLSLVRSRRLHTNEGYQPTVTLIIAVHNEVTRIERKIENTLSLTYPRDRLTIIFASDACSDATDEIISRYADHGLRLVRSSQRHGKEFAQRCAIEQAASEAIVFSDVATMLQPDGIQKIVANFSDPTVGCVSSEDRFIHAQDKVSGEGAYVKYETWLRSLESRVNSVVGLSGSFFAARRELCRNWPTNMPSDFNTLLNSVRAGYRGISDPASIGIYTNLTDEKREFERKVRTITRGLTALVANRVLLNPFNYPLFSWQLASHKLMRWFVPWFLCLAMVSNLLLAIRGRFYQVLLVPHLLFYILAFLGAKPRRAPILLKIPYYFVQVNRAILVAWIKYFKGERFATWTPSQR